MDICLPVLLHCVLSKQISVLAHCNLNIISLIIRIGLGLKYLSLIIQNLDLNLPVCIVFHIILFIFIWCSGPDHPSSGQLLDPTVGTRSSLTESASDTWTRSSLFWSVSGPNSRDQIIPVLVYLWSTQSGPNHYSSGVLLDSMVWTRSSIFWHASACSWEQIFPLLVCH